MANYFIGDFIRENRVRREYTQEELSFGICTPASLSRIENGAQMPGIRILDALLERLGVEDRVFDAFVSREEMELYETVQAVTRSIADCDYLELEKQILRMEKMLENGPDFERQYIIFAKGELLRGKGGSIEDVMQLFMQAIHMTLPEFDGRTPLEKNLLTFDEITIINNIAISHMRLGNAEDALRLEFWLKDYMENKLIDGKEKTAKYPMILYNLSNWLGRQERFGDALALSDQGVKFCIQYGNLVALPRLVFNKACALAELGNTEEAKHFFAQSAVIFETMGQNKKAQEAVDWCEKQYHITVLLQ
ncbi:MAG: helix-turn-helix domain-containing protein [Roseburia sp.]